MAEEYERETKPADASAASDGPPVRNIAGIQGLDHAPWTAGDGTRLHGGYETAVERRLLQREDVQFVESEYPVTVTNEAGQLENGRIDSYVEHDNHATLIDYKSNDMHNWSVEEARRHGSAHGRQMWEYIRSGGTPADSRGYILQTGRQSENPEVARNYAAAAEHFEGVTVTFPRGGDLDSIADAAEAAVEQTRRRRS